MKIFTQEEVENMLGVAFRDGLTAGFHISRNTFGKEDFMSLPTPKLKSVLEEFGGWVDLWLYCGGGSVLEEAGLAEYETTGGPQEKGKLAIQ